MSQINKNPLNLKSGEIVLLDKEFNNASDVEIVKVYGLFSRIKDPNGDYEWDVMTNRLTRK